jgi:hypothetical protein
MGDREGTTENLATVKAHYSPLVVSKTMQKRAKRYTTSLNPLADRKAHLPGCNSESQIYNLKFLGGGGGSKSNF